MKENINVLLGDITSLNADIIVNAANKTLLGGGGVDGAIHRKAGPKLLEECRLLNGCETGEAKITDAYNLPSKKIIHTVGPIYFMEEETAEEKLKSCYKNCMRLAEEYRKSMNKDQISIAFPCISTGIYRYPKEDACKVAVDTIREINNENIQVIFTCFDEFDYNLYRDYLFSKEKIKQK